MDEDGPSIPVAADIAGRSGEADTAFEQLDLQAYGELGAFRPQGPYTDQDRGEAHGALYQLSPDDYLKFHGGFVEIDAGFQPGEHTALELRAFIDYLTVEAQISGLPKGTIPPDSPLAAFNRTGRFGRLTIDASKAGVEARAFDTRFRRHKITYGVLWEYQAQDNIRRHSPTTSASVARSGRWSMSARRRTSAKTQTAICSHPISRTSGA
jgi:hypothetical protein